MFLVLCVNCSSGTSGPATPHDQTTTTPSETTTAVASPTARPSETTTAVASPTARPSEPRPGDAMLILARSAVGAWKLSRVDAAGSVGWQRDVARGWGDLDLSDGNVLLDDDLTIREYELASGDPGRVVFETSAEVLSFAVSPDRSRVAVTTRPIGECFNGGCAGPDSGQLLVLDLASGAKQYALYRADVRLREGLGVPGDVRWLDNSNLVLVLWRFSSSTGSSYLVDVDSDRLTRVISTPDVFSADASPVALAPKDRSVGCDNWPMVELRDLVTWNLVARLEGAGAGLLPVDLSPDGTEALIERRVWTAPPSTVCVGDPPEPELFLLSSQGARKITSTELEDVRRRWFGSNYLEWTCPDGLSRFRQGNSRFRCELDAVGTLSWNGVTIGQGATVVATPLQPSVR